LGYNKGKSPKKQKKTIWEGTRKVRSQEASTKTEAINMGKGPLLWDAGRQRREVF